MNRPLVALLAAGRASRFEGEKLSRICCGKPLAVWALDALERAAAPGLIVTREAEPAFAARARARGWRILANPVPERGIGHSIALAAAAARDEAADGLLLALADMPLVPPRHFAAMLAAGEASGLVATGYPSSKRGVPALFGAPHLPALVELDGDGGAAPMLKGEEVTAISAEADWLIDVDDGEGLALAAALLKDRAARP